MSDRKRIRQTRALKRWQTRVTALENYRPTAFANTPEARGIADEIGNRVRIELDTLTPEERREATVTHEKLLAHYTMTRDRLLKIAQKEILNLLEKLPWLKEKEPTIDARGPGIIMTQILQF